MIEIEEILANLIGRISEGDPKAFDELAKLLGYMSTFFLLGSGVGLHGAKVEQQAQEWIATVIASAHMAQAPYVEWLEHQFERRVHRDYFHNAARLQNQIMCELPSLPDCIQAHAVLRPRQRVSGDLILTTQLGEELLFVVGDVTGHGTAAAVYGSLALQLFQAARMDTRIHSHADPLAAVANIVNHEMLKSKTGNIALPVILCRVVPQEKIVEVLDCGSTAKALLLRDGLVEQIEAGGPPLGYIQDPPLKPWRQTWKNDDILVLPTDGLVEQCNPVGDMYSNEDMAQTLKTIPNQQPRHVANHIFDAVDRFADGTVQNDDQSLLVIRLGN
jgi:phosphoserine phosphatase RsbU/P